MGKFRIKWGAYELEYEGEDSEVKYREAFKWITQPGNNQVVPPKEEVGVHAPQGQRGGARKGLFAPEIKKLIAEGYFKLPTKRSADDVVKALGDRGIPVSGKKYEITTACRRLLRSMLKGTKTDDGWAFWTE